jgi:FixJ family two-component response regulator
MPGGDGEALLENVSKMPAQKPAVIMVTGFSDLTKEAAIKKGAVTLILIPFKREVLFQIISSALSGR